VSLTDLLRDLLGTEAASFQLMGEDLTLIPGTALRAAAERYEAALARVPPGLRETFQQEQLAAARAAHAFLRRYNRSMLTRLGGYLQLAARCDFAYPWPVVAMLGICAVRGGIARNRLYGLLGPAAGQLGVRALERLVEGTEDVLRRTNRGIFADSAPTVLLALRGHELRRRGEAALALALLEGPLPVLLDELSRAIARGIYDGLAIPAADERFRALADLTVRHFGREQAIFTHHLASPAQAEAGRRTSPWVRRFTALRSVPAPVVERRRGGPGRLRFRTFALPAGFDVRDHDTRVELFGRAFVRSVTDRQEDYDVAVRYVRDRFG
jgi:hypothetical protein